MQSTYVSSVFVVMSVLSLGPIFGLEPCGQYRWHSSIHCVVKHHQQGLWWEMDMEWRWLRKNTSRCKSCSL